MASAPLPYFFSLYLLQEWFSTLFFCRPKGQPPSRTDEEVILSARQEDDGLLRPQGVLGIVDLKRIILEISETCDAGLLPDAAALQEGQILQQDSTGGGRRRSQPEHSHDERMPAEMSTGFSSLQVKPCLPCFILDSRAPCHVASNASVFSSPSSCTAPISSAAATTYYLAPDGTKLAVAGVGTVSCDNFHLTDVLYVPGMRARANLVSVQQLAERDYLVMFGGGQCSVRERSTGRIVGKGRMHDDDGLYHLDFLTIP